jgi:hypothetical protein
MVPVAVATTPPMIAMAHMDMARPMDSLVDILPAGGTMVMVVVMVATTAVGATNTEGLWDAAEVGWVGLEEHMGGGEVVRTITHITLTASQLTVALAIQEVGHVAVLLPMAVALVELGMAVEQMSQVVIQVTWSLRPLCLGRRKAGERKKKARNGVTRPRRCNNTQEEKL